ncbi:MAG: sensor domain-containing diguanylate cyclase [Acidobacteria bacterium]|nr:sensor domain-containing diguanylate cyclase [Acidobacteriota bacterium]MBV9067739.1 sensor domain-containing diguanylate cyclase [Acidobacteriota bacterium]MBV9188621.1 sensor domain-containing diguanylate cyclase [Acidobacteriota bacterium]
MIQFHALEIPQLERFLERQKAGLSLKSDIDLDLILRQILQKANEFVPSESGSILLDDPFRKVATRRDNELVFIATFGHASRNLIGQRLSAKFGIVGQVYQTGTPYVSADVKEDDFFYAEFDEQLGHKTHSVVCVPIYIGKTVCGVLELINRLDGNIFTERDKTLLEIFAGYTSFTLQNALDAKRAHELAKKDDLTGLYNDRWFNVRLTETLSDARKSGNEAVLIFMDLDRFKAINDGHGHLAGSQVLREIGFLLKRIVQQGDATVARYGGDEFVIVLPNTKLDDGIAVCEDIRRTIEETEFLAREWGFSMPPLHLAGLLSASLGIAQHLAVTDSNESIDQEKSDLLRRADAAMYRAKSLGKNVVVVSRVGEELQPASVARAGVVDR